MERPKKQINVVWCDDNIDSLANETQREIFALHDCIIFRTAKTSDELKEILATFENFIDAVIVDFNMSDSKQIPGSEDASGFRWIHDNIHHYSSIPFYLFSARDLSFIKEKYQQYDLPIDNDYFLSKNPYVSGDRNRHFQADETEEMLDMIVEEVEARRSPTYHIRQEYSEAFAAIDKFGLDGNIFFKILLSDEGINGSDLSDFANPLRKVIEYLMSKLKSDGVINYSNMNDIPKLLGGKAKDSSYFLEDDLMPDSLSYAFVFFLSYTQDGSHHHVHESNEFLRTLKKEFHHYLKQTNDIYLVKALAIICLDIIKWTSSFYDKYLSRKPFSFTPFIAQVERISTYNGKEGAIVHDDEGKTYYVKQEKGDNKYQEGTTMKVTKRLPIKNKFFDYVAEGENLDIQ